MSNKTIEEQGSGAPASPSGRREPDPQAVPALRASVPSAETIESIIAWGDETFGPCSQDRAIERAGEEWAEMEEDGADVPIEAADVIICLLRIPGILDAINRKMTINRGRTWDVRPDGTGYHVKPTLCNCGAPAPEGFRPHFMEVTPDDWQ